MNNKVLIIVAHSDDETIGMGGTIKKHSLNGDKVFAISMTDGISSRKNTTEKNITERLAASKKASGILKFEWVERFSFLDNELDTYSLLTIVKAIEEIKNTINPDIVYTHSNSDLNIDHRVVLNAVLTAFRPQPKEDCREIRLFEILSSTDYGHEILSGTFQPNLFIDINSIWAAKYDALIAYGSEIKDYPHTRSIKSIENLAKRRGNQVGLRMAEAFQVIRKIEQ